MVSIAEQAALRCGRRACVDGEARRVFVVRMNIGSGQQCCLWAVEHLSISAGTDLRGAICVVRYFLRRSHTPGDLARRIKPRRTLRSIVDLHRASMHLLFANSPSAVENAPYVFLLFLLQQ